MRQALANYYISRAGFKFVMLLPLLLKVSPSRKAQRQWGGEGRSGPPSHSLLPPEVWVRGSLPSESQDVGKCYRLCGVDIY